MHNKCDFTEGLTLLGQCLISLVGGSVLLIEHLLLVVH